MTASVYVARSLTKGVKVGYSNNTPLRLKQIASAIGERVALVRATEPLGNAPEVEAMAHWMLREQHDGGEWFTVDDQSAVLAVDDAIRAVAAGEVAPRRINNATPFAQLKDVRLQLEMSAEEVAALDDWRAPRHIWSRSAAIRRLIAEGVKAKPKGQP